MAILKKQNPDAFKQISQQLQQMEQAPMTPAQNGATQTNGAPPQPPQNGSGQPTNGQAKESVSVNYKDAPEDIKRQMEYKAGFRPSTLPPVQPQHAQLTPARP